MVQSRGSKARTEHGSYLFTVKEAADGSPWIMLEPRRTDVTALKEAFIGFGLRQGTTIEKAQEVADYLNRNLADLSFTMFDDHRYY